MGVFTICQYLYLFFVTFYRKGTPRMLVTAVKVFFWLFPFIKEIFITNKNANKKKNTLSNRNTLLKKVLITIGLASFILLFVISNEYFKLKGQLALARERSVRVPETKENTPAIDPPDEDEEVEKEPDTVVRYPKPKVLTTRTAKAKESSQPKKTDHVVSHDEDETIVRLQKINELTHSPKE